MASFRVAYKAAILLILVLLSIQAIIRRERIESARLAGLARLI